MDEERGEHAALLEPQGEPEPELSHEAEIEENQG